MNEFTQDEDYVYLNVPYAEAYIPDKLFTDTESAIFQEYGDGYKVIGIFQMRFFDTDEVKSRDSVPLKTLNYPNEIETYPSGDTTIEKLSLNGLTDKYRVLRYYRGDIVMNSKTPMKNTNCETFLALIMSGRIPPSIPYDVLLRTWETNFEINGESSGVPAVVLQVVLSEQCRDRTDPTRPFRKVAGQGGVDPLAYRIMNMNDVAAYSSVMAAMSFERLSDKLVTSLSMTKTGAKQNKSPVEAVLSM